jgi:hypothetical protein
MLKTLADLNKSISNIYSIKIQRNALQDIQEYIGAIEKSMNFGTDSSSS